MKRIAIYCRVSTLDQGQTVDTQLYPLRQHCEARGLEIVEEYCDRGVSGSKDRRPALDRLMADARRRKFDGVMVFKFDRFGRSVSHLIRALEEFQALGVEFVSLTEAVDSSTAAGKLMFTMLSAFAEFERSLIIERVKAGMTRAKSQGKHCGRPERIVDKERIRRMREDGMSIRLICREEGLSVGKVYSILR